MTKYVILGGGVAGVTAARALARASSDADEVHIFSAEPYPYYPRPLLWQFIAGQKEQDELYFRSPEWYAEQNIKYHLNSRITEIDTEAHRLTLDDGSRVRYDRLLIATGARPFVPPSEGTDKEGVFTLRTLEDALAIKSYTERAATAIVVGGGLLGLETARALQATGLRVTVIEVAPYLLPRQLDREGAQVLQSLLEAQGLRLITDSLTEAVLGETHATGVQLKDGPRVDGDLVLFSTGIRCRAKLAKEAGLEVNRGLIVDEQLRTSAEDVFAAGDVAEFEGQVYGIIPAAIEQARAAASNMSEPGSTYYTGTIPSTTLQVADAEVTTLGEIDEDEGENRRAVRHADIDAGIYRKFTLEDGRVIGFILLNDQERAGAARQLIQRGIDVSGKIDELVEDDFDLKSLLS